MVDIPPIAISFKYDELQTIIRLLRAETRIAEANRHWKWAEHLRFLLLKLGDDPQDL